MDLAEAVEAVVAETGNPRFRDLCDSDHPAYDPRYVAYVLRRAGSLPVTPHHSSSLPITSPLPTVAESWDLTRRMKACPFRSIRPGGCNCARCALRRGDAVSRVDCFACLERYG